MDLITVLKKGRHTYSWCWKKIRIKDTHIVGTGKNLKVVIFWQDRTYW